MFDTKTHSKTNENGSTARKNFFPGQKNFIQPKLTINQPNDIYEQEADAVAERVMRMPDKSSDSLFFQPGPLSISQIQRKCASCEQEELQRKEDEEEEPVQLKPIKGFDVQRKCSHCEEEEKVQMKGEAGTGGGMSAPSIVHNAINSGGQSLDRSTKNFMESRFGYDFGTVQIHNDSLAHQSSKEINALAYTHGYHVVFGSGQYQPNTDSGRQLLAHELAHVVQQGNGLQRNIQRHTLENDPATAPAMSCPIATTSPAGLSLDILFTSNSDALTPLDIASIDNFVNNWHLSGGTDPVRVDGYASIEGGPALNWPLSCSRAEILLNELTTPTSGAPGIPRAFIDIFANGETEQFSTSLAPNRRASITIPLPIPPPPPATAAVFSESATQVFQGYDNTVTPNFQVIPAGETRVAAVTITPVGALPTFVSLNPAIATVSAIGLGVEITGVADGSTRIEARQGATVLDTLQIEVKAQRNIRVDYHFMSDTARRAMLFGLIPAEPQHSTSRAVGTAPGLTARLNRIWQRQANVLFTTGTVDSPVIASNLGPQVVFTRNPATDEWRKVIAFATGGNWNVYLVWEYEQDATPAIDDANGGTLGSDTLVQDNDCGDFLTLPHEAGHFLSGATLPHTAADVMAGCPSPTRDRVRKNQADAANP
jgi:outer membrane protein OmpA-like peptidoglycan-associated protein